MTREKERITLSLDVLKDKFRESDSYDLDSDEIENYMKESLYGNEEVSYPMDKESFELARGQIEKICDHLESVGLSNAGEIRDKFQNPPDTKEGYEVLSKIKATMESIVFTIDKVTNLSSDEVAAQYRDRQFACGPGTLSNLQSISSEMVLANQGIEAYIVEQKRKTLEQIAIHA